MTISTQQMYEQFKIGHDRQSGETLPDEWSDADAPIRDAVNVCTSFSNVHTSEQWALGRAGLANSIVAEVDALKHKIDQAYDTIPYIEDAEVCAWLEGFREKILGWTK